MDQKKIKVGFFIAKNPAPSETFIVDLVKALSTEKSIDLTVIKGEKKPEHYINRTDAPKVIYSGFQKPDFLFDRVLCKIVGFKEGKRSWLEIKQQKKYAERRLNRIRGLDIDIAYVDYANVGVVISEFLQKKNIPLIVHVHGYDITSKLKDPYYRKEFEELVKYSKKIIAASNYIKRILILAGCESDKIEVIRLGVEGDNIQPQSWKERLSSNPRIVFLGRLTAKKHPIALVEAFNLVQKKFPLSTLTIIGDGPLKTDLEERINKLKLRKKIKMLGTLTREEALPILNEHWIYAQHSVTAPSGDQEGFAISLAEAALLELPVVSTIHNGITENVLDGITGFLVPEFHYEAMAEKIICLIEDPELCRAMGEAGREHIKQLCDPRQRVASIKNLLFQVGHGPLKTTTIET